jgi:hypothetical protein
MGLQNQPLDSKLRKGLVWDWVGVGQKVAS